MSEIKADYYPRMNALLQEDEISKLQVQVNLLLTENADLKKRLEDAIGEAEHLRDYRNDPLNNTSAGMLMAIHNTDIETIEALKEKLAQYEVGRPMSEAPLDGTQILCEIKDRFGVHYEIIEWNEEVNFWTGSVFDYQPMYKPNGEHDEYLSRWWPLPGGNKNG